MELNFVTDVMLVMLVSLWTCMIILIQIMNFMSWMKVPYEMFSKLLNLFIHSILIFTMWLNIIVPGTIVSWILIGFSALLLIIYFILSGYQRKYIDRRIDKLKKEIEKEIEELRRFEELNKMSKRITKKWKKK